MQLKRFEELPKIPKTIADSQWNHAALAWK